TPALLTIVYVAGLFLLVLLLLAMLIRLWITNRRKWASNQQLPREVRRRLGSTTTNRGLQALRILFVLLAISVFSFHVYWAKYAAGSNQKFEELNYKDLRNRRLSASTLRGWIYDRKGRPLAYYKRDKDGNIDREYPMDSALAHIF